jgi:hypothetical protein
MVRPDPRYGETVTLSSQTIKILNNIQNGLILVPDWFNNNIEWVQTGHVTEQEFITSYDYLITSGIAHTTIITPEPVAPAPDPVSLYWVQKPSQQPSGRPEAYHLTESTKQKWLSQGYIIATMEPKYQGETILWESCCTQFPSGMQTNQLGERYRVVTSVIEAQQAAAQAAEQAAEQAAQQAAEQQAAQQAAVAQAIAEQAAAEQAAQQAVAEQAVAEQAVAAPDISINTNMVTQQLINFNIVNGRAVGSIKFVATNNFNPYYFNNPIVNIIQFKDPNGVNILTYVKQNTLNFTETERDEVINYDEDMHGNTRATVESFVWSSATAPTAFSNKYTIDISEKEPPKPVSSGFMSAGVAGAIAGLILIGFIADYKRGK